MGVDTKGKIRGYANHRAIFEYIRQHYDSNAVCRIPDIPKYHGMVSEIDWDDYRMNEHSIDMERWYGIYGSIDFKYNDESRSLFYHYSNVNSFENLDFYKKHGLEEMVTSETTSISLSAWGHSIDIIRELVEQFGGGWMDDNDCDDKEYYEIQPKGWTYRYLSDGEHSVSSGSRVRVTAGQHILEGIMLAARNSDEKFRMIVDKITGSDFREEKTGRSVCTLSASGAFGSDMWLSLNPVAYDINLGTVTEIMEIETDCTNS